MSDCKYVILNGNKPILFANMNHNQVANSLSKSLPLTPTSAGFVSVAYDERDRRIMVSVYGESTSLNLKSNKVDAILIESMLFGLYGCRG
uniref:Uncharacterized protein n=1 Tax=viral metagenome TaxID=1070528 RepID=A0A6M3JML5_9ZZZZ